MTQQPVVPRPGAPRSCTLADGRALEYRVLGDPAGQPVVLFHGFPGSSADFLPWHDGLRERGLAGVAVDRPGQGGSGRSPGRRLTDWPADVVALMDHLSIPAATVLGVSGGGPHALVCAAMVPARFVTCVVVNSGAPVDTPAHSTGMSLGNRLAYRLARRLPWIVHVQVRLQDCLVRRAPATVLRALRRSLGPEDSSVLDGMSPEDVLAGLRSATRCGTGGVVDEFLLHARPWGVDLGTVGSPVVAWHGDRDRLAPLAATRWVVDQVPDSTFHELPGRGHLLDADPEVLGRVLDDLAR